LLRDRPFNTFKAFLGCQSVQLTAAEFFRLLGLLETREKLAVSFAGWLGPRVSEIFGLKWQDLDLQNRTVSFRRGFVQGRIMPLKTEASRTNLPLPDELMGLLRQWHSITPYNKPDDWISPRHVRRACVRSGRHNSSRSTSNLSRWLPVFPRSAGTASGTL
jgi:integrase